MNKKSNILNLCDKDENCFGMVRLKPHTPIMFPLPLTLVKVMIISEQPLHLSSIDKLKELLQNPKGNNLPRRLKELLGDRFTQSIADETGVFYWTHFIKCPGNLRDKGEEFNYRKCADRYIPYELQKLRPSLVICIGKSISDWCLERLTESRFFEETGKRKDWKDIVIEQMCMEKIDCCDFPLSAGSQSTSLRMKIIFLIHPSERSQLGWRIDKHLKRIIDSTIDKIVY